MHKTKMLTLFGMTAVLLLSCATKPMELSIIPPLPASATPDTTTIPKRPSTLETVTKVDVPTTETANQDTKETQPATVAQQEPIEEKIDVAAMIDQASASSTMDEFIAIANALADPRNNPDGKLTLQAVKKASAIITEQINTADAEGEVNDALNLLSLVEAQYPSEYQSAGINTESLTALAAERICAIQAYDKNSIYFYLKNYPKGHYTKELSSKLTQKMAK